MITQSFSKLGAASGAIGFALTISAIVVGASTGTQAAGPGAGAAEIARAYAAAASPLVWIGAGQQVLGLLALFDFVGRLSQALGRHAGDALEWLVSTASGAARAFVLLTLAGFAVGSAARFRAGPDFDLAVLTALFDIHVALYVASWAISAVFLAAAAVLVLRTGALPVWLGWAAALFAVVNLAAVALPASPLSSLPNLLIWLWALSASIALLIRPGAIVAAAQARPPLAASRS
jgi:hypothetical protein